MDTVTHGLTGYLIGRAFFEPAAGKRAVAAAVLTSLLADADYLLEFAGTARYILHHRGWTHSAAGVVAGGLLCAWLLGRGRPARRRAVIGLAGAAGVASHIFLDLLTSFGTMWLLPFTDRRDSLDWTFIIDPAFTILLALGAFATWVRRWRPARAAAAGLAAVALYLGLCAFNHDRAQARFEALAQERLGAVRRVAALPMPYHAFLWRGLIETPEEIHEVRTNFLTGDVEWRHPWPSGRAFLAALPRTVEVEAFVRLARFPTVLKDNTGGVARQVLADRQFGALAGRPVFQLTVGPDEKGGPAESRFSETPSLVRLLLYGLIVGFVLACMRRWEGEEGRERREERTRIPNVEGGVSL